MVVTQSGAVGVAVANHVTKEFSTNFVPVPTRHQHMAGEVAGDWGGVHKDKHAICINALVIFNFLFLLWQQYHNLMRVVLPVVPLD